MSHSRKFLSALLCFLTLETGCQNQKEIEGSNSQDLLHSSIDLRGDMDHMRQLSERAGSSKLELDLSDEAQYRFLRARLAASGKTPANSPQYFAALEKLRTRQKAERTQFSDTQPARDHIIGDFAVLPGGLTFEATSFATIEGGADYNFVDVVVWNEDQSQQLSDYGWGEVYGDGRKLKARATGPVPFYTGAVFTVDSVNLISRNGVESIYLITEKVRLPPGGGMWHPVDSTGDKIVTICLDRNYGDCDYPMVGYRQVQIPLKGYFTFPFEVLRINNNDKTYVKLVDERGGPREMKFGPFASFLKINPNDKRQVYWDVPQNLGVFNGILFERYEDVDFFLSIDVDLSRVGRPVNASSKISSIKTQSTPGMPVGPKVQIVYSCLAKGTQVKLGNGKTVNIETITKGSQVVADSSGVALTVQDVSVGIERIPMVRIQDDAGHELLLTASHPVITPDRGVVWAEELREGNQVLTQSGVSTLVTVKREMYRDNVYNLKLDTSTLAKKTYAKGSTLYANGFLVGDLSLQKAFEFKNSEDRSADVQRRLPSPWHTDYQNSLKLAAR